MIGRLSGILAETQAPYLLLDVQGVGYELQAPMTTFYRLPELGAPVILHTHFAVSETAQQLFGFIDADDRRLFRQLIKVNGLGPKMALAIMSMESDDIVRCVMEENVAALVKVPGVGKKTAERMIVEMRDKLKAWRFTGSLQPSGALDANPALPASANRVIADAESALVALGYKPAEAARAISMVVSDAPMRSEELIRLALKNMLPA